MNISEIKEQMETIYKSYIAESAKCTSVQRSTFDKKFEAMNNVKIKNSSISLASPVELDEVLSVIDVKKDTCEAYLGFFSGTQRVKCYYVFCKGFAFYTKLSSGAEKLNIGQKIRVFGKVDAFVSKIEDGLYVSITDKPFSIKFEVVE